MPGAIRRRFFLLDEPCAEVEIGRMMGRVVEDPRLPLLSFRPLKPSAATTELMQSLLPDPDVTTNRRDFAQARQGAGVRTELSGVFGIDVGRERMSEMRLDSLEVKRYTLQSCEACFEDLMEDDDYAKEVRDLLRKSRRGKVYLVVGLMTTRGTVWRRGQSASRHARKSISAPMSLVSVPALSVVDPSVSVSNEVGNTAAFNALSQEEQIFAVAYCVIREAGKMVREDHGLMPRFVRMPHFDGPKFARPSELAFHTASKADDNETPLVAGMSFEYASTGDDGDDSDSSEMIDTWLE